MTRLAREIGFVLYGDFRLNIVNSASPMLYGRFGDFKEFILSPELILPQARDIRAVKSMIVYGRLPLMLLEKSCGADRLYRQKGRSFSCLSGNEHGWNSYERGCMQQLSGLDGRQAEGGVGDARN